MRFFVFLSLSPSLPPSLSRFLLVVCEFVLHQETTKHEDEEEDEAFYGKRKNQALEVHFLKL